MTLSHGFRLVRTEELPEIDTVGHFYVHEKTGAEVLSLVNGDENKCFGISFRTPVSNSTGVAHILEHSVLCGSRKYPLKEPFVDLLRGSLQTFLNAFTYPDRTCYPIASQNLQDFYNLMDVYLDTVFYPRLQHEIFQQEGWHLEIDPQNGKLVYRGVVFNEMKGAYASPDDNLDNLVREALFPNNGYRHDSGGNPAAIPDLTYEAFVEFHRTHYHPSNSMTVVYGDDPEEARLERLDSYFNEFERIERPALVDLQPTLAVPHKVTGSYPAGQETDSQAQVSLNWLLPQSSDIDANYSLNLLEEVLLGTPVSPLRKALLDSGLGDDLTPSGLSAVMRQMTFSVGMKGVAAENTEAVEKLILSTLEKIADEGVPESAVEAAFNTLEFQMRENNTGSFPRGLALMVRSLTTWTYDGDPLGPVAFQKPMDRLREKVFGANDVNAHLKSLIRVHLLQNQHRISATILPDPALDQVWTAAEQERLAALKSSLGEHELAKINAEFERLQQMQHTPDSPEAQASLPSLHLSDLPREVKTTPTALTNLGETQVLSHDLFSNGILYAQFAFNLRGLPARLVPYLHLFSRSLTELGTLTRDATDFTRWIGCKTGGVGASAMATTVRNSSQPAARLMVTGKATAAHIPDLFAIIREAILEVNLDNRQRFEQMVQEEKARLEAALAPAGRSFIASRLQASYHQEGWFSEITGGIEYLLFVRNLAARISTEWPAILADLRSMFDIIIRRHNLIVNLTADSNTLEQAHAQLPQLLQPLNNSPIADEVWPVALDWQNAGFTIPGQVNHVGLAVDLANGGFSPNGSAIAIQKLLGTTWLWERVRQEGGAYGAGASISRLTGIMAFASYRDPNLTRTLENFRNAARFLESLEISDEELERTVVGSIGSMDAYQLPDGRGFSALVHHLAGITDGWRQQSREELMATTREDIRAFGAALQSVLPSARFGAMASEAAINAANTEQPGLLQTVRVL